MKINNLLRAKVPALLLVLLAALAETRRLAIEQCEFHFMRLPRRVQPTHYKLDIRVDPEDRQFSGRVEIELLNDQNPNDVLCRKRAAQSTPACDRSKIILSADKSLKIEEVEYSEQDSGLAIPVVSLCRDNEHQLIVVQLSREPNQGSSGKLMFDYSGKVQTDFTGLFRSDYHTPGVRKAKHIVMTQFESAMARKVLPCFDEPDFKATFELAVEHPSRLLALANTRPEREEQVSYEEQPELEYIRTYFSRTPKMSSYLLAFAVGEFDLVERTIFDGQMTIGIYTPPGRGQSPEAEFSLDIAVKAYLGLHDFFGVSQPVRKIDFVSCKEFPGGMENWGLIAIEEATLLPNLTSYEATDMHSTYITIVHELAHQWFGNLVTMRWWDDLWLNEGFASWISNELTDQLFPELEAKYLYLLQSTRVALLADSDETKTHPIKNLELHTIQEIEDSFDKIIYEKSDAVLSMLRSYIGPDQFKRGLGAYIRANQFRNTEDTDLWSALAEASGLDVQDLMRSWLLQAGFPLITATLDVEDKSQLRVSQTRFRSQEREVGEERASRKNQKWIVPISLWVSDGKDKTQKIKFVMSQTEDAIKLPAWFDLTQPGHWLKLNSEFEGFYRLRYATPELLAALRAPIETKTMSPADRVNILEDAFGLMQANLMDEIQVKDMLGWFKGEDHDAVVDMICQVLRHFNMQFEEDEHNLYAILIRHYEQNNRLAPETSPSLLKQHARADVLQRLVMANYEPAIGDSIELFEQTGGDVPGFIKYQVFGAVAKGGSLEQYKQVINLVKRIESKRSKNESIGYLRIAVNEDPKRRRQLEQHFGKVDQDKLKSSVRW